MTYTEAHRRGVRLQAARKLKGLSQLDAAKKIGVSRVTLSGWENGEAIDEQWVALIASVLGASKAWVRYGEGTAPAGWDEPTRRATRDKEIPVPDTRAAAKKKGA